MAIVSLGMDLCQIDRIDDVFGRRGDRFLERVFTPGERAYCDARKRRWTHYAGRFAVKEAAMKALGTGWARGVRWVDFEVVRQPGAAPQLALHGEAAAIAEKRGIARMHITITHDGGATFDAPLSLEDLVDHACEAAVCDAEWQVVQAAPGCSVEPEPEPEP